MNKINKNIPWAQTTHFSIVWAIDMVKVGGERWVASLVVVVRW